MSELHDVNVPVLIVGGGGAGLTASMLLSSLGVPSLLVSRLPETSQMPKAHILNQRTMEIFADAGVAPAIYARATPSENFRGFAWYSGLGGSGPKEEHGRRLAFAEAWGGGHADPDYIAASPCATANLPLIRLEPILKAHAESSPLAQVRFNHELVSLTQDAQGVTATILDRDSGDTYRVRSAYVLGADGGRTVGDQVGIRLGGSAKMRKMIMVHISADLSAYFDDPDIEFRFVFNPEHPEHLHFGIVLVAMGPDNWGHKSEEWSVTMSFAPDDPEPADLDIVRWMRETLGLPDFNPTIHHRAIWWMETMLADQFRADRVFLLGDAAHRNPPTGGLGLNCAIQDAYNLCWKLAAVLNGRAGDGLLDTYEAERRTTGAQIIATAVRAAENLQYMSAELGVSPEKSVEENRAALRLFWDDVPGSAERRQAFSRYLGQRTLEYRQHGADFGYTYQSAAVVSDGAPPPVALDAIRLYQPSTRPGAPLPHAWTLQAGEWAPLRALIHGGHFAVIAGEDGGAWVEAAERLAKAHGLPLRAARVGVDEGDLIDIRLAWLKHREISRRGAILVRPDGYIAFRALDAAADPEAALATALAQVLDAPVRQLQQVAECV